MAHTVREIRRTTVREGDPRTVERREVVSTDNTAVNIPARIVSLLTGIIVTLLGMRFILSLLGANRGNLFADFIYSFSHPFVAPFFGLFNYQPQFGAARFEFETLVAIAFWAFVGWIIIQVLTIDSRADDHI